MTIRLIVLDVDGCLTAGEAQPFDLDLLGYLASLNRRARCGEAVPAVTLCTGRPSPYVEATLQAIDGQLPAIYESGCGLYVPDGYRFLAHPAITAAMIQSVARAERLLRDTLVASGRAFLQPGKSFSLSVFPCGNLTPVQLAEEIHQIVDRELEQLELQFSASCVNVMPAGIDKARGLHWLSEKTGIPLADMLGVGDSIGDIAFLETVGHRAAPANAHLRVKARVDYVASRPYAAGVREILSRWRFDDLVIRR
ncbi:MAG TPA: HAD family phosphatase [Anaerolineae bacterium]|nr:HAD family phosphatase [Anaerolineae bacterium]